MMNRLPESQDPLVVRTDFSNDQAWQDLQTEALKPWDGFDVYLTFVDLRDYEGLTPEELLPLLPDDHDGLLFIVDRQTMASPDRPVLVVDFLEVPYASFRAIPRQLGSIGANLQVANMDFFEFAQAVDEDGVFRDFSEPAPPEPPPETPSPNLYVGNLPFDATNEMLHQAFSAFGRVVSAETARDPEGRFRGFARVVMDTVESASKGREGLNGQPLGGRAIFVAFDGPQWPR